MRHLCPPPSSSFGMMGYNWTAVRGADFGLRNGVNLSAMTLAADEAQSRLPKSHELERLRMLGVGDE